MPECLLLVVKLAFLKLLRRISGGHMGRTASRAPRKMVVAKAHLRIDVKWAEVAICNVSETGLMVRTPNTLRSGDEVEIRRKGVRIVGEVAWATRTRFGVRASEPIDVDELLSGLDLGTKPVVTPKPRRPLVWQWQERRYD